MKKRLKIVLWIIASLFVLTILLAFGLRESIMHKVIDKVILTQKEKNHLNISISESKFEGIASVVINKVVVVPDSLDTLISIEHFKVRVSIWPLFFGHIKIAELETNDAILNLVHKNGKRNFDFLLKKEKKDSLKTSTSKIDLANLADNLINDLLYKVPDLLSIKNYKLNVIDDEKHFFINAQSISIQKNELNSTFVLNENEAIWHADGMVNPTDKKLDIRFFAENKKVELPYLEQKIGLKLNFDTISTRMDKIDFEDGQLKIFGNWTIKNLLVNHIKIAQKDVVVNRAAVDCNMFIGENFISIDSSSIAYLGEIIIHPFIKYSIGSNKIYELEIETENLAAQSFFNSFPQGLFETLEGIKVDGQLAYKLNFYLDSKDPWHCKFDSRLVRNNFKILAFGTTNLQKMNGSFTYIPYEYGRPTRAIIVGPESSNFTPYEQISDFLKNAILTSEDPLFFSHRGFYEEAFRQSIATNFVAGRFKRGGSTISMQLVKNAFLNRNKTVARKLEEMLIVWLIENNRLTSKQRMYEVYLNIIEWAPNVYGVTEASRFYFDKIPSQLTLGESIFLASIVPKPKKFKYSFLPNAELKPYMRNYFKMIGGLMVRRGKVLESDTINMFNSVILKGNALNHVLVVDTLRPYSLPELDDEEIQ